MSRSLFFPLRLRLTHGGGRQLLPNLRGRHSKLQTIFGHQAPRSRNKCTQGNMKAPCHDSMKNKPPQLNSLAFWTSKPTWRRAATNTLRCLIGCTSGDFSAMWYLQSFYSDMGMGKIMAISMISGLSTSLLLETVLLRYGRDHLSWRLAMGTAAGMSMISMLTMELAENAVDYSLTGGVVQLDSPTFWAAAIISITAGFLAPLPYNYIRLRRYGRACH